MNFVARRLGPSDFTELRLVLRLFSDVFADPETYQSKTREPSDLYLAERLSDETFFVIGAFIGEEAPIGALAAYELKKFEQERTEVYIYDLAVRAEYRRKGVATAMIRTLGEAARKRGAWTMFVQADIGEEDEAANALYKKLASEMIVANHYDIKP